MIHCSAMGEKKIIIKVKKSFEILPQKAKKLQYVFENHIWRKMSKKPTKIQRNIEKLELHRTVKINGKIMYQEPQVVFSLVDFKGM